MKQFISFSLMLLLFASFLYAGDGKKYGKDLTLKEKTSVSTILETPDQFEGKTVLIEGTVLNVCAKAGCWIEIASDKEQESIIVKVEDGEIVFPMEAKGQKAVVEGAIYSITVKAEACVGEGGEKKCGEKEEGKETADCKEKHKQDAEKVTKKYMIKGHGAIIG